MSEQNDQKTFLTLVLDESGSMLTQQDKTISGINEFLDSQEDKTLGECRASLVKFNDKVTLEYSYKLIEDVPKLTSRNYSPGGMTALYDAIAFAIKETDQRIETSQKVMEKLAGHEVKFGPLVVILIATDGAENISKQYDQKQVFDMIKEKKDLGWTFIYIGADQDSFANAGKVGILAGNVANFAHSNINGAFSAMGQSMSSYRSAYTMARDDLVKAEETDDTSKVLEATANLTKLRTNYFNGETEIS